MGPSTRGPDDLIGQLVAGYRLERLVGIGATGAVYFGRREHDKAVEVEREGELPLALPMEAAVKVLVPQWQSVDQREEYQARFVREARVLKQLRHSGILAVLDSGEDEATGVTYMVLPFLSGGTLAGAIEQRSQEERAPFTLAEISALIGPLADALDYAHAQGVIHRDIKPANILLDGDGRPMLADFSILKLLEPGETTRTTLGKILGTPAYMSPEQIAGNHLGPAADIYSLGMVLYELVTGRVAFEATSVLDMIRKQAVELPPAPRSLRSDLPEPAEAAILKALRKDPAQRFGTAKELASAFTEGIADRWSPGLTVEQSAPVTESSAITLVQGEAETALKPLQRSRSRATLPLALAAAVMIGVVLSGVAWASLGANFGANSNLALTKTPTPTASPSATATLFPTATARPTATTPQPTATARVVYLPPPPPPPPTATPLPTTTTGPAPTPTPTPQRLYSAVVPGSPCDSGGAAWLTSNASIACLPTAMQMSRGSYSGLSVESYYGNYGYFPNTYHISVVLSGFSATGNNTCLGFDYGDIYGRTGGYQASVCDSGLWDVLRYDSSLNITTLASGTTSASSSYQFDLAVSGATATITINGVTVTSVNDSMFPGTDHIDLEGYIYTNSQVIGDFSNFVCTPN